MRSACSWATAGTSGVSAPYGGTAPAFIGKLVVTFADGSTVCVVSDSNWIAYTNGPVLENDLFDGRLTTPGVCRRGGRMPVLTGQAGRLSA